MLHAALPSNTNTFTSEPPFAPKTIDCMHQTGPIRREHNIVPYVTPTGWYIRSMFPVCPKWELFFLKLTVTPTTISVGITSLGSGVQVVGFFDVGLLAARLRLNDAPIAVLAKQSLCIYADDTQAHHTVSQYWLQNGRTSECRGVVIEEQFNT